MIFQHEARLVGGEAGPGTSSCLAADDPRIAQNHTPPQAKSAAAVAQVRGELLREWLVETLGFAQIYAENCKSFADLGDDTLALLSLGQFHKAAKAACRCGSELQALKAATTAPILAETAQ